MEALLATEKDGIQTQIHQPTTLKQEKKLTNNTKTTMSTEQEMEKLERKEKRHTSTKLEALFAHLNKNAYEGEYHKYWIKQANQIIRTHFEALEKDNEDFATRFAEWLKTKAYSKDGSWYIHEAMDGNTYTEKQLMDKYKKHLEETKENTLVFIKETEGKYWVRFNTHKAHVPMGELIRDIDGYFYWFPVEFKGTCVSEHIIKAIADKLSELNVGFTDEVKNYLMEISKKEYKLDDDVSDGFHAESLLKSNPNDDDSVSDGFHAESVATSNILNLKNRKKTPQTMTAEETKNNKFILIKAGDSLVLKHTHENGGSFSGALNENEYSLIYKNQLMTFSDFFKAIDSDITDSEIKELAFSESKKQNSLEVNERHHYQGGFEVGFKACMEMFKDKKFTEEDMLKVAKYGYEYRDTTQFPEHKFEDSCINNTKQFMEFMCQKKNEWNCTYENFTITIID